MGQARPLFISSSFSQNKIGLYNRLGGVLGIRTRGMIGADESTELWWRLRKASWKRDLFFQISIANALKFVRNPVRCCRHIYHLIKILNRFIEDHREENEHKGKSRWVQLQGAFGRGFEVALASVEVQRRAFVAGRIKETLYCLITKQFVNRKGILHELRP